MDKKVATLYCQNNRTKDINDWALMGGGRTWLNAKNHNLFSD